MKLCPTCRRRYADETLNFCLEDGAPLVTERAPSLDETLTLDAGEPPPTEILDPALAPTINAYKTPPTAHQQARPTVNEFQNAAAHAAAAPTRRNTTSVVALTAAATILLLGLGGLGAWLLLKDNGGGNTNIANIRPDPSPGKNVNSLPGNTPEARGGNMNTQPGVIPTPTSSATPSSTPQPTPQATDTGAARREVAAALEGWRRTMINPDVGAHMSYYAPTLHTYYNARNVDADRVRSNVARAFQSYSTFDVRITNLQIEVDTSGETAVATFDKTFEFTSAEKRYAGSGLNKFWFEKIGGRWLITGEKDLKTYYVNN
jgi:hypothetical protein